MLLFDCASAVCASSEDEMTPFVTEPDCMAIKLIRKQMDHKREELQRLYEAQQQSYKDTVVALQVEEDHQLARAIQHSELETDNAAGQDSSSSQRQRKQQHQPLQKQQPQITLQQQPPPSDVENVYWSRRSTRASKEERAVKFKRRQTLDTIRKRSAGRMLKRTTAACKH